MFELGSFSSRLLAAAFVWAGEKGLPPAASHLLIMTAQAGMIMLFVLACPLLLVYGERKVSAWMQARVGPTRTGPFGLLQTVADGVKLFLKEDTVPRSADALMHLLAPLVAVLPVFACFAPIPFGQGLTLVDLDAGVLTIFALSSVSSIGILMAGWGSGNKFSMLGGLRGAAQLVSYEIPRALSVVPVVMMYGTQSLRSVAEAQSAYVFGFLPKWFIFYPVFGQIAFAIFLISSLAETNRVPFDIPEAESELVAGFHTEYSGMKFALFFLSEYAYVVLASAMGAALFLGGAKSPFKGDFFVPSWAWFGIKTAALVFLFFWFRWTFPRMRVDRLMQFCWRFLLPWSLINIFLTAAWILWRR
jgi:NADH-quinone oxidoreductase subunit H